MVNNNGETRADDAVIINAMNQAGIYEQSNNLFGLPKFSKEFLERLYTRPVLRKICHALPVYSILEGWDISFYGDDNNESEENKKILSLYKKYENKLFLRQMFANAQIQANLYGGSALIFYVDDGLDYDQPVNFNNIKSIQKLKILDSNKIYPATDHLHPDPAEVEHYYLLLPLDKNQIYQNKIHASRLIRFDGVKMPVDVMTQNNGWGFSLLEILYWDYDNWRDSLQSLKDILKNFNLFIYGIADLTAMIADNDEAGLAARFKAFKESIFRLGGAAIDRNKESLDFISKNLSGADSISQQLRDAFIGASGVPHDKLFGESPSGLGATGESEARNWAQEVKMFQELEWSNKLLEASKLIMAAKDGPSTGKGVESFYFKFLPIIQETTDQKLNSRNSQAQMDVTYQQIGALTVEEIRRSRFGKGEFSFETELDDKAWERQQQQLAQQQFGFDSLDQGDAILQRLDQVSRQLAQLTPVTRKDENDELADLVAKAGEKNPTQNWIRQVNRWLSSHESLENAADDIETLYNRLNDQELRRIIEEYLLLSDLEGNFGNE